MSHPDILAVAAALHGIVPAFPSRCRVLEVACGDGSNLLPMAFHRPEARFTGIDASARHIASALRSAERLGLENVSLLQGGLERVAAASEHFDYVIIHNVISFLPDEARRSMLASCRDLLSPNGVVYLTYNTRAGWLFKTELRTLLHRHASQRDSQRPDLERARRLLEILDVDGLDFDVPLTRLAKYEVRFARTLGANDLGLMLSQETSSFRFSEIASISQSLGLHVFDELSDPSKTLHAELRLRAALLEHVDDPAEAEDLAELVLGTQVRAVVARREEPAIEAVGPDFVGFLEQGLFSAPIGTRNPDVLFDPAIEVAFSTVQGHVIRTKDPFNKGVLVALMTAWPRGRRLSQLAEDATALLREKAPDHAAVTDEMVASQARELLALRAMGAVSWASREVPIAAAEPERPKVFAVNAWQASRSYFLTDPHHHFIALDEFTRRLVPLLDGSRDEGELIEAMLQKFASGELVVRPDEKKGAAEEPSQLVPRLVRGAISGLTRARVVEAPTPG